MYRSSFKLFAVGESQDRSPQSASAFAVWMLILVAALAPVAGGCQFRWGWGLLVAASGVLLLCGLKLRPSRDERPVPLEFVFVALAGLHLFQLLPLPRGLADFLAPVTAQVAPSFAGPEAWRPVTAHLEATRDNLLILLGCWVAYRSGWTWLRKAAALRTLGLALLVLAACLSIYGLFMLGSEAKVKFLGVPLYSSTRVSATYTNPNRFAGFLELVLPLGFSGVLGYALSAVPLRKRGWEALREGLRGGRSMVVALLAVLFLIGVAALFLTYSRMGIASFFAGAAAAGILVYRKRWGLVPFLMIAVVAAVFVLVGLAIGLEPVLERFTQTDDPETTISRSQIWAATIKLIAEHPLMGGGSGAFRALFPVYQSPDMHGFVKFAHNDYLNALADLGLLGGAILLTAAIGMWRRVRHGLLQATTSIRLAFFGIAWAVASILFHSFTDSNLQEPANAWLFCLLLGAGLGLLESEAMTRASSAAPELSRKQMRTKWLARAALGAFLIVAGGLVLRAEMLWTPALRQGWPAYVAKHDTSADRLARRIEALDPSWSAFRERHAQGLLRLAESQTGEDQAAALDRAQAELHALLRIVPLYPEAWYLAARLALLRGNDMATAERCMAHAQFAAPHRYEVAFLRAQIALQWWIATGRPGVIVPDDILALLEQALQADATRLKEAWGLLVRAAPWESRWARIVPAQPAMLATYALLLAAEGYREEAAVPMADALRLADATPESARDRRWKSGRARIARDAALLDFALGREAEALDRFSEGLRTVSVSERWNHASELWRRLRALGATDGGLGFAQALAQRFPDEAWAHELLGRAFAAEHRGLEAAQSLQRAVELQPTPARFAQLANALNMQGLPDTALVAMQRACDLEPGNAPYRLALADLLSRRGYHDRANEELLAAERLDSNIAREIETLRKDFAVRRAALQHRP